ncbi:MAG: exodeoxyribonuclease VII large subunit [Burkholderiaceae bacterium]|jgi:exodeoxyribonuclease VII large subunit|nr:exodeoxyribonuclease VII large subunit [Burkholderiaceae bacterium]
MNLDFFVEHPPAAPHVWAVGALCRAVADALGTRFNPVAIRGEISGFARAASGHCYFTLKDNAGQLRCVMFQRAAQLAGFLPRDGDQVQVRGRLGLYEARGDLQVVVESIERTGQGALFEQFQRIKQMLQAEGLFDARRKRPLPAMPRGIGLVTSQDAAALHDVATALLRRAPHIPVWLAPASVQGAHAPSEMIDALQKLYRATQAKAAQTTGNPQNTAGGGAPAIDVILLVRGGGSMEDLWAFNDAQLARAIAASPVPVITGVGHETDFSIADFAADLRAPTPTAAAELVSAPRDALLAELQTSQARLRRATRQWLDRQAQRLDIAQQRLGRPRERASEQQRQLDRLGQRLAHAIDLRREREQTALARLAERLERAPAPLLAGHAQRLEGLQARWTSARAAALRAPQERLERAALRLRLLDPALVLERGYAWLSDASGQQPVTRAAQTHTGQTLQARLADGALHITVNHRDMQATPTIKNHKAPNAD